MQVAFEAMGYIAVITNFGLIALLPSVKQYSRGYSDAQVILFFVVVEVSLWIRTTVFRGNFFPNSTGSSGLRDCQTPESCETSFSHQICGHQTVLTGTRWTTRSGVRYKNGCTVYKTKLKDIHELQERNVANGIS